MQEEIILNSAWKKCRSQSFSGRTYSKKGPGFKINFQRHNIMKIRGGNLGLPNFVFLQLGERVRFYFDHERYVNQKWILKKDFSEILDKLDNIKTGQGELDESWQILRLLDPRTLLKKGAYKIWGSKSSHKFYQITLEYNLSELHHKGIIKIPNEFLKWLMESELEKRTAIVYIDHNEFLYKISQKELLPPTENVSIIFDYAKKMLDIPKPMPAR